MEYHGIKKHFYYTTALCLDYMMHNKYVEQKPSYYTTCVGICSYKKFTQESLNQVVEQWNQLTEGNFIFDFEIVLSFDGKNHYSPAYYTFIHDKSGVFDKNRAVDHLFLNYLRCIHEEKALSGNRVVNVRNTFKRFNSLTSYLKQPCGGTINLGKWPGYNFSGFFDLSSLVRILLKQYPKEQIINAMISR
jgi:hypothetical protein